jgi:8-amino-7-oxononanoate synthase
MASVPLILGRLQKELANRREHGAFRSLVVRDGLIDFCSNDYLGFAQSSVLMTRVRERAQLAAGGIPSGSTGSRLLSGNSHLAEELESELAAFHAAPAALLYNSGYDANLGLLSCLASRGDTVLYDELAHASIRDGIRLGLARAHSFRHNDVNDLARQLASARGSPVIVVESLYSMDGDLAPLADIAAVCERRGAALVVDEAHATGVFGEKGQGRVQELGLEGKVFARLHTFGKALGCHGAVVVGAVELRDYLVNSSRALIFSTALPPHSLIAARCAYELLAGSARVRARLGEITAYFMRRTLPRIPEELRAGLSLDATPIRSIIVPGNDRVLALSNALIERGFDARPIRHPAVPRGKERIRVCLHSFNTEADIDGVVDALHDCLGEVS